VLALVAVCVRLNCDAFNERLQFTDEQGEPGAGVVSAVRIFIVYCRSAVSNCVHL